MRFPDFRERALTLSYDDGSIYDEKLIEIMGNRDNVWYASNGEIYKYVKAFDSIVASANNKYLYNPTAIYVYLKWYDKEILVRSGQTVEI